MEGKDKSQSIFFFFWKNELQWYKSENLRKPFSISQCNRALMHHQLQNKLKADISPRRSLFCSYISEIKWFNSLCVNPLQVSFFKSLNNQ